MSKENINLDNDGKNLIKQEEDINLLFNYLMYKYLSIEKAFNFFIENFLNEEEKYKENKNCNILNLFLKNSYTFYDNICSIKQKLNLFKQTNNLNDNIIIEENIVEKNNEINCDKIEKGKGVNNNNIVKIKEYLDNYYEYIKDIANAFDEYSNNILKDIKNNENRINIEINNHLNINDDNNFKEEKKEENDMNENKNKKNSENFEEKQKINHDNKDNIALENKEKKDSINELNIINQNVNQENIIIQNNANSYQKEDFEQKSNIEKDNKEKINYENTIINPIEDKPEEKNEEINKLDLTKTNCDKEEEKDNDTSKITTNSNENANLKENEIKEKEKEETTECKIEKSKDNLNEEKNENDINIVNDKTEEEYLNIPKKDNDNFDVNPEGTIEKEKEENNKNIGERKKDIENSVEVKDQFNNIKEGKINIIEKIEKDENRKIDSDIITKKNIRDNLENIVENIISSIIKTIITEPKFIIQNIIESTECKIINSLITDVILEKKETKLHNNDYKEKEENKEIQKEKENQKVKENEEIIKNELLKENESINEEKIIKNNIDKSEKLSDEHKFTKVEEEKKLEENNEIDQLKSKEKEKTIKEKENGISLENHIKNMDSLLEIHSEEEDNANISQEMKEQEIQKEKETVKNEEVEKDKKEEAEKNQNLENEKNNLNENKETNEVKNKKEKENLLDKEMKELEVLLNEKEINNLENIENNKEEKQIIEDNKIKNEGNQKEKNDIEKRKEFMNIENINNEKNIDKNPQKVEDISQTNILNKENKEENVNKINYKITENEKTNSDNNTGIKKTSTEKEFDFDINEEDDIDIIIKNKSNNDDLKSNIIIKIDNIKEKKEITETINKDKIIIKKEEKEKNISIQFENNINVNEKKLIENKKKDVEDKNKIIKKEQKLSLPLLPNLKDKEIYIESAIKKMFSSSPVLPEEYKILLDLLFKNSESAVYYFPFFLNALKNRINKKAKFLPNFENFKILMSIIENIIIKEKNAFIFDLIIELSQYLKYENNYLYQYIRRKIVYFNSNNFWKALIENLLINELNERIHYIIKRENEKKEIKSKSENLPKKGSFWKTFFTNPFQDYYSQEEENMQINDNDINNIHIIEIMGYNKYLKNYQKLNNDLKKELDNYGQKSLEKILFRYIKHMSNYGFDHNLIKILIMNFCAQFSFNNEFKEYYINLIDCYNYKDYNHSRQNLSLKNGNNIINNNSLICILSNIFIFLPEKERIKLLILNKKSNANKALKHAIFKKLLRIKNLSLNKRLVIWEDILNISKLKKEYNYSEIKAATLKKISSEEFKKETKLFNNNQTIYKDVSRTAFLVDKMENQTKLSNILGCLNILNPSLGYYQGISYIAGFILQLLDFNEEKTFYYMLALETQTVYKNLFLNNLELLNNNFRIFEKILEVGLPDVYMHLNKMQVMSDYYVPSWFLTVFACISPIFDKKDLSKFCILVFEKFIFDGWDAVFNAGFTALKYLNREILKTKEEMIYNYLTNDFPTKDVFNNSNFDIVEKNFIKNSEFINCNLISIMKKICAFENLNKKEED